MDKIYKSKRTIPSFMISKLWNIILKIQLQLLQNIGNQKFSYLFISIYFHYLFEPIINRKNYTISFVFFSYKNVHICVQLNKF